MTFVLADQRACDAITGSEVILLFPTSYLLNLSEPFLRPFPEGNRCIASFHVVSRSKISQHFSNTMISFPALFIQFAMRGWKTIVRGGKIFTKKEGLFNDAHKR